MFKRILVVLLVIGALLPFSSSAQTADEIAKIIADLSRQIAELKVKLAQLQGQSSGAWCHTFNSNLGVGLGGQDKGTKARNNIDDDVAALIQVLSKEGLLNYDQVVQPGTAGSSLRASYYGETVAGAVSAFQLKYKDEILAPLGLSNPTGYVGPSTRKALNRLYGCKRVIPPISGNLPPTISGVSGPTIRNIGETGTWTVNASDPENGPLEYSVVWGDEEAYANVFGGVPLSSLVYSQTATFTHVYTRIANPSGTTYTPAFLVKDNTGQLARVGISVNVGQITSPITVLTPNGGEVWLANSVQPITWRYAGATSATKVDLYLNVYRSCPPPSYCTQQFIAPIVLDKNIPSQSDYNWIVATDMVNNPISPGNYTIQVCKAGSVNPGSFVPNNNPDPADCDSSDNYFTISNVTVISPNGGEIIKMGSTQKIKWSSASPFDYVDIRLFSTKEIDRGGDSGVSSETALVINNNFPDIGSYDWLVPQTLPVGTYRLWIGGGYVDSRYKKESVDYSDTPFTITN